MHNYTPRRKKIRGWKRRIKQIDHWGERIKDANVDWFKLNTTLHHYKRCYLSPFYMAERRHPPLWFYKLIISKFIKAYEAWEQQLKQHSIPFDLMLWIYDPAFIQSEIIAWKVEEPGTRKRFVYESRLNKPFPYKKFESQLYNLHDFEWVLADDELVHFEDDFDDADFTPEDLLADGYVRKVQRGDQGYYSKRVGDIWIGRRKGKTDNEVESSLQGYFAPPSL